MAQPQVAIVTDSTSDLEPGFAATLGIDVVPLIVLFGDKQYRDYLDLSRPDFYKMFASASVLPTTSQPSAQSFADAFRPHVEAGQSILCVVVSSGLSGTLNAASAGAAQFPGAKITVFDTHSASGGLAMHARHAAELARAGAGHEEILTVLERWRATENLYVALPDLSHVVRTGRVSRAQGFIGGLLKIVPVLRLGRADGKLEIEASVRTFARAQETMLDTTVSKLGDVAKARVCVIHANAPELARSMVERLRAKLPVAPLELDVYAAGPVVAAHAGPGAVAISSIPG